MQSRINPFLKKLQTLTEVSALNLWKQTAGLWESTERLSRRAAASKIVRLAGVGTLGVGSVTAYGNGWERHHIEIVRRTIMLPHLPAEWDGMVLAQLSDFHHERFRNDALIQKAVALTLREKPDLIALTGDFISGSAREIEQLAQLLHPLKAAHGVWACLGNHDHRKDGFATAFRVRDGLKEAGVRFLINQALPLGHKLWIAGLESRWAGSPQVLPTLRNVPEKEAVLMLAHEPDVADAVASAEKNVLLQLSGHSHAGQIRVPGGCPICLPKWAKNYYEGLYGIGKMKLYVNRGLGCTGLPIRIGCPPELTILTLRKTTL